MTNYGNRGQSLEEFVNFANSRYRAKGEAVVWKVPTPFKPIRDRYGKIVSCKVDEKSCTDYVGRVGNIPLAAEAKETKDKRISYSRVEDHQAAFLDDFTKDNAGIGLVIVSFNLNTFWAIPWAFWKAARDAWKNAPKSKVTVTFEGTTWETNGMASVSEAELLPEWEVKPGGTMGLDYLWRYI